MKSEKLQTIFIHWLNTALQDPRWRAFIRARLRESELPVIELTNKGGNLPTVPSGHQVRERASGIQKVREELVIYHSD